MENIEQKLNNKIKEINPPRSLFNSTMNLVTPDDLSRNTILKGDIPSPYKTTYSFFVKKITYVGLPVIAIIATYILFFNTGVNNKIEFQNNPPVAVQNVDDNNTATGGLKVAELDNTVSFSEQSIDSLISDIISAADDEALFAINSTSDDTFINSELDQYNSLNTNTYEEII